MLSIISSKVERRLDTVLEVIGFCLLLVLAIKPGEMSDRKKIEKIFEYVKVWTVSETGIKQKCRFIMEHDLGNGIGTEYIYRLPLGMQYKKLEYLNDNIGVFKDGLNTKVALEFIRGMLIVSVSIYDLLSNVNIMV